MTKENEQRVKIFKQAMKACHSNNPIDCVEWFADKIIELKKENQKLLERVEGTTAMYIDLQNAMKRRKIVNVEIKEMGNDCFGLYSCGNRSFICDDCFVLHCNCVRLEDCFLGVQEAGG